MYQKSYEMHTYCKIIDLTLSKKIPLCSGIIGSQKRHKGRPLLIKEYNHLVKRHWFRFAHDQLVKLHRQFFLDLLEKVRIPLHRRWAPYA